MKVVAYSVKPFEKEFLAKANQKKHDITLIFNSLSLETAVYGIKLANVPEYLQLQDIANQVVKNLDRWEMDSCVGKACICANGCKVHKKTSV
jgi:hypothetical protein